jgi:hypothetical protein
MMESNLFCIMNIDNPPLLECLKLGYKLLEIGSMGCGIGFMYLSGMGSISNRNDLNWSISCIMTLRLCSLR